MYHVYKADGDYPGALFLERQDTRMWTHMRRNVLFQLGRNYLDDPGAMSLIHRWPFELWQATDHSTPFELLRIRVLVDEFDDLRAGLKDPEIVQSWNNIAKAMWIRGREIRYISLDIVHQKLSDRDVESPRPFGASDAVELALENIDSLLERGAMPEASAIDRLHTAIHGYMFDLCDMAKITPEPGATISTLFSLLRANCPEKEQLAPIFRSLATVLDTLGSLRNKRSLAHPSYEMLGIAEARLALNAGKTLLR